MPTDAKGRFHNSTQRAMAADKAAGEKAAPPLRRAPRPMPGLATEAAPSPAAEHLRDLHAEMGGKHFHAHQGEDGSITSHAMSDGIEPEPHTHADVAELQAAMDEFFAEELAEPEMEH